MKTRNSAIKITLLISIVHCFLGNLIGANTENEVVEIIFLPYSLIGGMSNLFGWDSISIILEFAGFIIMTLIFYPIGILLSRIKKY